MKKHSKIVLLILIFISLCILISFFIFVNTKSHSVHVQAFHEKMNLLEKAYQENEELNYITGDKTVILSISNKISQAIVKNQKGSSFENTYQKVKNEMEQDIQKKHYDTQWIKLDFVNRIEDISQAELHLRLMASSSYQFRNGLILSYPNREIVLTEAELNSNQIFDYDKDEINITKLNQYLSLSGKQEVSSLPDTFKTFTTISYFLDENNNVYEIDNADENTGRRKSNDFEKADIEDMIYHANDYLSNMVTDKRSIYLWVLCFNK